MASYLDHWTDEQVSVLEEAILVARHRIHETGLFSDEALADLIDQHPDDYLTIAAMGNDASRFEWMTGERGDCSAKDLMAAVRNGQLWLNVVCLGRFHAEYQKLVDSVYDELERRNPKFRAMHRSSNLLISSPNAMVYYHIDLPVNMLWHLRGEKQVWVYPPFDRRFVSPKNIERLINGEMAEDMPYETWFEDYALSFRVRPGDLITWPQNTPHRVTNCEGLNVSLSTEHRNKRAKRRTNVHLANSYLRKILKTENPSTEIQGFTPWLKEFGVRSARVVNKVFGKTDPEPFSYRKRFVVDPQADLGYRLHDETTAGEYEEEQAVLIGS